MSNWAKFIGVFIICCQMAACGGGASSTDTPASDTSVNTKPSLAEVTALTEAFNSAQALWANTAPANYHYTYKEGPVGYKFDAYSPVTIWVQSGKIAQVTSGIQVLKTEDYTHASIEQLFIRLSYTMSHSPADTNFHAEYDPLLGFPTQFKVTPGCCAAGTQLLVTDLQIDP
ncbi:MAG: hypothetical protein RL497_508 [Pseudomonadota bacterium]|jgi:hypothetical protein